MHKPISTRLRHQQSAKTILVVDDSVDILDLMEMALSRDGYALLRACTIAEALEIWEDRAGSIDLVVTDVKLAESSSGLDLAERLLLLQPDLKVLAVSGFLRSEQAARTSSRISFLQKPFRWGDFLKRVQDILESVDEPSR
jgi:DNA-binding NtrC family response regulator